MSSSGSSDTDFAPDKEVVKDDSSDVSEPEPEIKPKRGDKKGKAVTPGKSSKPQSKEVVKDYSSDSESEIKPKKGDKKGKAVTPTGKSSKPQSKKRKVDESSEDESEEEKPKSKKSSKAKEEDDKSELPDSIDLGNMRFATKSNFKGKEYINIREYYRKDNELLPGKKGITFTPQQFKDFVKKIPAIEKKFL